MLFINRHSFVLVGVLATVAAALIALHNGLSAARLALVVGTMLVLLVVYWRFNAGASTVPRELVLQQLFSGSLPTLVELQSPY